MRRLLTIGILVFLILITSWSLFHPGMFKTHDFVHAARISEMGRALSDHHWPPRWSRNFGYGFGMPLFSFYAPLPYVVGALFWLMGFKVVTSIKLLYFISTAVVGLGAYQLTKHRWGYMAGLVGATLTMMAPYRAVNMFVRGALSELWGIMAVPWVLFEIDQIFKGKKDAWWKLAIWMAVLLLSHNLTALIALPVIGIWVVLNLLQQSPWSVPGGWQAIWRTIAGGFLGLGLASFYIWPAFLEKSLTQMDKLILGGYFNFNLHFLYLRQFLSVNWGYGGSAWGPNDGLSFFLGFGQWLVLVVAGLWLFKRLMVKNARQANVRWKVLSRWKTFPQKIFHRQQASWKKFDFNLGLGVLLMTLITVMLLFSTFKTQSIWQAIPFLSYIQFPWRVLGVVIVLIGVLGGWLSSQLPRFKSLPLAIFIIILSLLNLQFFIPSNFDDHSDALYYTDPVRIQKDMSGILPDFIPAGFNQKKLGTYQHIIYVPAALRDQSEPLIDKTHQRLVGVNLNQPTAITFSIAYFPGWQVEIDGKPTDFAVTQDGLIEVKVPAGNHRIGLLWTETKIRHWSDLISLLSLAILLIQLPMWRESERLPTEKKDKWSLAKWKNNKWLPMWKRNAK